MTDHKKLIQSALEPAINDWFRRQSADLYAAYYLYYRKARPGEKVATPIIARDIPGDEWALAMPEKLSISWTKETAQTRCYEALQTLPILSADL